MTGLLVRTKVILEKVNKHNISLLYDAQTMLIAFGNLAHEKLASEFAPHRGPAWHTTTVDVDVIYEHSSKLIQSCGRGPWNQLYVCLYGWKIIV